MTYVTPWKSSRKKIFYEITYISTLTQGHVVYAIGYNRTYLASWEVPSELCTKLFKSSFASKSCKNKKKPCISNNYTNIVLAQDA